MNGWVIYYLALLLINLVVGISQDLGFSLILAVFCAVMAGIHFKQ